MYANYKELEDAVVDWLDREDVRPVVSTFVELVTRKASRQLRVPTMERTQIVDVYADGSVFIPLDLVELKTIDWLTKFTKDVNGEEAQFVSARMPLLRGSINNYKESKEAGAGTNINSTPHSFSREGSLYKIYPLPPITEEIRNGFTGTNDIVGSVEVQYFALPATLNETEATNWLLSVAPEVYFYGALSHGYEYVRDYETAAFWNSRFENAISEIQAWSLRADDAGGMVEIPLGGQV